MAPQPPKPGFKGPSSAPLDARAREELERQDRHRTEALLDESEKLEEDLERLKARFELYFLGIERREPAREREEMKRRVARLKGEFTRNTGLRFRIETLHARFLSYERMWMRSAREKEEGTYRRDLMKARRRAEADKRREEAGGKAGKDPPRTVSPAAPASEAPAAAPVAAAPPAPPREEALPAASPAQQPPTSPTAPPPAPPAAAAHVKRPAAPLPAGMTEEQVRTLHSAYIEAKKRCNEDTSRLSYEALASTIAKQVPELMAKYKARTVEFKVVIKDGRAILKAVPRL